MHNQLHGRVNCYSKSQHISIYIYQIQETCGEVEFLAVWVVPQLFSQSETKRSFTKYRIEQNISNSRQSNDNICDAHV